MKILYLAILLLYITPAHSLSFSENFESGKLHPDLKPHDSGGGSKAQISSSKACKGTRSLKSHAKYPPDYRTEVSLTGKNPFKELKNEKEYWIGFAVFLDNNWPQDGKKGETIFQAHHRPDKREPRGGNPPFALGTRHGKWQIKAKSNSNKLCGSKCQYSVLSQSIGAYKPNTWTEFVFNVKFTHKNSGFLKVWKNGQQVLNYSGPIGYNDENGPWLKLGLYKSNWRSGNSSVKSRTVFHDEFSIKAGKGKITDVSPNCNNRKGNLAPPSDLKIISN